MPWNWDFPDWPKFTYNNDQIASKDKQFFLELGKSSALLKTIDKPDYQKFVIEILSTEGIESSKIENEILDRESLQSSIRQHLGLKTPSLDRNKESGMAKLIYHVYESFNQPLTHEMIGQWHYELFNDHSHIETIGKYRTHTEPMQIVSSRYDFRKVFFEAPPSDKVHDEMTSFINWFNSKEHHESLLGRTSIAHVYFESIHPFEDGNGRIGRLLVEKMLSESVGRPVLIAVSKTLEQHKKEYYAALEHCNRSLNATLWVDYFSNAILQAQEESMELLYFLIAKAKMFTMLQGQINQRQEKVLLRMFAEGKPGFKGGLSAENYIAITKTSKATATRDLSDLVEKLALLKTGELRHTRYFLNLQINKF